jgi:hypothetical protein
MGIASLPSKLSHFNFHICAAFNFIGLHILGARRRSSGFRDHHRTLSVVSEDGCNGTASWRVVCTWERCTTSVAWYNQQVVPPTGCIGTSSISGLLVPIGGCTRPAHVQYWHWHVQYRWMYSTSACPILALACPISVDVLDPGDAKYNSLLP